MNKLSAMIERYVAPMANKLARQKYVQAIQSTFLTMIPFLTVGSFALILISPRIWLCERITFGHCFIKAGDRKGRKSLWREIKGSCPKHPYDQGRCGKYI